MSLPRGLLRGILENIPTESSFHPSQGSYLSWSFYAGSSPGNNWHALAVTRSTISMPNDQMVEKYVGGEGKFSGYYFYVWDTVGDNTVDKKAGVTITCNPLILLVGGTGLEPVTLAL